MRCGQKRWGTITQLREGGTKRLTLNSRKSNVRRQGETGQKGGSQGNLRELEQAGVFWGLKRLHHIMQLVIRQRLALATHAALCAGSGGPRALRRQQMLRWPVVVVVVVHGESFSTGTA